MYLDVGVLPTTSIYSTLYNFHNLFSNKIAIFKKKFNYHIKSQVNFGEKNGKTLVHHKHELIIPFLIRPKNASKLVDRWSIFWEEDSEKLDIIDFKEL